MNNMCDCELGKTGKRRCGEGEDYTVVADRLTTLPDFILYHILSFLDTKYAVRTSGLSRVWRCVWKHVPVLDLRRDSFRNISSFMRFTNKVLSSRYQLDVPKISYVDEIEPVRSRRRTSMLHKVIKYAFSHGTQHLVIDFVVTDEENVSFDDMFSSISNCGTKTLELRCVVFDGDVWSSRFQMLTTLKLDKCVFYQREEFELCSDFPRLMNLVISNCKTSWYPLDPSDRLRMKIVGQHLLSLKLTDVEDFVIEIVAPKLESFSLRLCLVLDDSGFSNLTFPSLDHADIMASLDNPRWFYKPKMVEGDVKYHFGYLFQGLRNAKSVILRCKDDEVLKEISKFLEHSQSPFTRLKSLVCVFESVPYTVLNYTLEKSSDGDSNVKCFRRQ